MISRVIIADDFIKVYDEDNAEISTQEASNKEIAGVAAKFYVVYTNSNIEVYNAESILLSSMSREGKIVSGTVADTFTVKNDIYIESYDENCNLKHINNMVAAMHKLTIRDLTAMKASLLLEQQRFSDLKNLVMKNQQYEVAAKLVGIGRKLDELIELIKSNI